MAAAAALGLSGCSALQIQGTGVGGGSSLPVSGMQGTVYGGQQPINGATIQLYAAGMTGYGSAALPLLPTSGVGVVTSDGNGYFTLPAYVCPSNSYVYITASGGNPQLTPLGSANADIALMAALGSCATLQANAATTFTDINEVTTIAGIWALQQFGAIAAAVPLSSQPGSSTVSPSFTIGTSSTNVQGLANAFGIANVLANTSLGSTPGANTSGTTTNVENWQVNTLANILASCVNSNPTGGDTGCSTLFTDAKVGSTTPADTLQAAWMIAQNPGNNVQTLFGLATGSGAPFSTTTDNFVNDWTIGFAVTPSSTYGTYLGSSSWIAFDSFGNAWVTNDRNSAAGGSVMEFDPQGNIIGSLITQYNLGTSAATNLITIGTQPTGSGSTRNTPYQVYVDPSNNAWIADSPGGAVFRVSGSGSAGGANGGGGAAAYGISTGSASKPSALAIDGNGIIWTSLQGATTGYSSTFASSTTGVAGINPTLPVVSGTTGPLGGGFMAADSKAATTATNFIVVDTTKTATYAAAPFLDVITDATCSTSKIGTIANYFAGPAATITGSSSNTTTTQGGVTPANLIINATPTCSNSGATLPAESTTYASVAYSVPALYTPVGGAVDGNDNLWILNTAVVSTPAGYPVVALSKLTPSYTTSATTGALSVTYTTTAVTGGGLPSTTVPQYIAIDGANNVWATSQQCALGGSGCATAAALTSFEEFNQAGTPLSTSTLTPIDVAAQNATGWFGGNTGTATQRLKQTRRGIAIDLSGNVWSTDAGSAGYTLFILVGAAAPTVTPLSLALKNGTVGTRP